MKIGKGILLEKHFYDKCSHRINRAAITGRCLNMKKRILLAVMAMLTFSLVGCGQEQGGNDTTQNQEQEQPQEDQTEQEETSKAYEVKDLASILQAQPPKQGEEIAVITTNKGEMRMMFYPEEAPKAVENFKTLAKQGYFDGLTFHRVIDNFMIQSGDPTGTGTGGESMWKEEFEDEISPKLHFFRGTVAMANRGPNTNGSQFFIVQNPTVEQQGIDMLQTAKESEEEIQFPYGDKVYDIKDVFTDDVLGYYQQQGGTIQLESFFGNAYTIFGQVYEGLETVDAIAAVETDGQDKPVENVIIEKITFEEYQG